MSFRAKFFVVSLIIPAFALSLFLYLQLTSFRDDKVVFIYEMQNESLRSAAIEFSHLLGQASPGPEVARYLFSSAEWTSKKPEFQAEVAEAVCAQPAGILWRPKGPHEFDYWLCRKTPDEKVIFEIENRKVASILAKQNLFSFLLVETSGRILADDQMLQVGKFTKDLYTDFSMELEGKATQGQFVTRDLAKREYFASFLKIEGWPLGIVALISREAPEQAAIPFLTKGVVGLAVILILVAMIALVVSRQMTQRLQMLISGVKQFGAGKLDFQFEEKSPDEFGLLAQSFNHLVQEIRTLVTSLEEKAKVEKEMSLAARLQQAFTPRRHNQYEHLEVLGEIRPAALCGGDWWFLFELKDSLVVGIGDVTGHGIDSAMITSASRGALATIQNNFQGVSRLATELNHAIYETAQEAMQMTFVCMEIARDGTWIRYCNASHEASFLFHGKDVEILGDIHGPRLGQEKFYDYAESCIEITQKDWQLWLFTDGATEVSNRAGRRLGDKLFMKWLQSIKNVPAPEAIRSVFQQIDEFSGVSVLEDDICLVLVRPR